MAARDLRSVFHSARSRGRLRDSDVSSYAIEKKLSKHPEEFGKGAIEGVAGPEPRTTPAATGVLVPLLTLGIPTSGDSGDPAWRVPELRPAAGAAAVPVADRPRLGPDREPLHRQHHPADPQPAADRDLGARC
jgi:hypothetical protein